MSYDAIRKGIMLEEVEPKSYLQGLKERGIMETRTNGIVVARAEILTAPGFEEVQRLAHHLGIMRDVESVTYVENDEFKRIQKRKLSNERFQEQIIRMVNEQDQFRVTYDRSRRRDSQGGGMTKQPRNRDMIVFAREKGRITPVFVSIPDTRFEKYNVPEGLKTRGTFHTQKILAVRKKQDEKIN